MHLARTTLVAGALLGGTIAAAPTSPGPGSLLRVTPPYVQVEPVADSTWVLRAGTANVVAALTGEGWVLVDTGTRAEAMALRNEVQRLSTRPIVAVFNTHFHDDHAGGNVVYRGMGVPIYAGGATRASEQAIRQRMERGVPREAARLDSAAARVPPGPDQVRVVAFYDFLARWWREGLAEARRDPQFVVPADHPFTGRLALRIGGLAIEARSLGRGHTGDDVAIAFPARRVLAAGDVVVRGTAPWADQFVGEGSMDGVLAEQDSLLAWLASAAGEAPADTAGRIVPGHGAVMTPAQVHADRAALRELRACARQAFDAGRPGPIAGVDCAGVGFPGESASYAVWLFDHEWRLRSAVGEGGAGRGSPRLTKP
jgi:glyoxylase-like metal-dependent hydrolase (beta-lactamase superfamily II)